MSQPDLIARLQGARPAVPAELREHVRLIAAADSASRRLPAWRPAWKGLDLRRFLAIAVPVAAAAAAAVIFLPGSGNGNRTAVVLEPAATTQHLPNTAPAEKATSNTYAAVPATSRAGAAFGGTSATAQSGDATVPGTSASRVQKVTASLELRVSDAQAISDTTKRAVAIARSLGGYPKTLNVDAERVSGYASIVLRIPKQNVQKAVARLGALGTIVGENVSIQDIQAHVDLTTTRIAKLKARLAYWQSQYQSTSVQKHVASIEAAIAKLQRGKAQTIQQASYATVSLALTTKAPPVVKQHAKSPLHGLGVAFHWIWIGGVYALALGGPVVVLLLLAWWAVRASRRRAEERLLAGR